VYPKNETSECKVVYNQIWCSGVGLTFIPILSSKPTNSASILDISNNRITTISGELQLYPLLESLNIANNDITTLDTDSFQNLSSLQELSMARNKIHSFTLTAAMFKPLTSLHTLSLAYNHLGPSFNIDTFKYLHNLVLLDLDYNSIVHLRRDHHATAEHTLPYITELKLKGNVLLHIPQHIWSLFPPLIELDLSGNAISSVNGGAFKGLIQLKSLLLNDMDTLMEIEHLAFADTRKLQNLEIMGCAKLKEIQSGAFGTVQSMRSLHLENNALETLSGKLLPWEKLTHIFLYGNPWICDCRLNWIASIALQNKLIVGQLTQCAFPDQLKGVSVKALNKSDFVCIDKFQEQYQFRFSSGELVILIITTIAVTGFLFLLGIKLLSSLKERQKVDLFDAQMSYGTLHELQ
jgi:hypothetical protein